MSDDADFRQQVLSFLASIDKKLSLILDIKDTEQRISEETHDLKPTTDDMKPGEPTLEGELIDTFGEQILEYVAVLSPVLVDQLKFMGSEKWKTVNNFLKDKKFKFKKEGGKGTDIPYHGWWEKERHEV